MTKRVAHRELEAMISNAQNELCTKSNAEIEKATAYAWAARAIAAYRYYSKGNHVPWLLDAVRYHDEAIEHAAVADVTGGTLSVVQEWMHTYIPKGTF